VLDLCPHGGDLSYVTVGGSGLVVILIGDPHKGIAQQRDVPPGWMVRPPLAPPAIAGVLRRRGSRAATFGDAPIHHDQNSGIIGEFSGEVLV
jgi:hypothetical protein